MHNPTPYLLPLTTLPLLLLLLLLLPPYTTQIDLTLTNPQTCLDYLVPQPDTTKTFHFHYNHNIDNVNMVLYYKNVKQVWHETGFGVDYRNMIEVEYKDAGKYTLCFVKSSAADAEVSVEIVDEEDRSQFVGKEQLAKISRRVSQFLVDIKRVGINFKEVLKQHNARKEQIFAEQNTYGFLLLVKCVAMIAVVVLQILVVKRIFR